MSGRCVFLFTVSGGGIFAALTQVVTKGWPAVARTEIAATTMSDRPTLHFLAKVAARVCLILAIMILEIPFIQMAEGLCALVLMPILMLATLVILGYIWWWSEPKIVRELFSLLCPCFLSQAQVTPQRPDYIV